MSRLQIVIRHEYWTIVKQPSFWISMLATPILIALAIGLSYLGNQASGDRIEELAKDLKNVAIVDQSGLISADVVNAAGLKTYPSADIDELRDDVRTGDKEALVVYPDTLRSDRKYSVYLSSDDFTKMGSVASLADNLLKTSLFLPLGSAEIIALAQGGAESQVTTYRNGEETAGLNEYVVPGLFVLIFYIVFLFSVGYMLTSVSEEKENRSMEMVLTYVEPRNLIVGKLLAVILVTFTQIVFFVLLAAIAYVVMLLLGNTLTLPAGIDLQKIVFDPLAIFFAVGFLVVGFLMFAGFMTATAAIAPSTKEANSFSSVFYVGAFLPFYFVTMILTDPENPITKFLTFFPITSPVVALVRNAVGNMGTLEASLALAAMTVFMVISIWVAVRAFSLGALEYASSVRLRSLFKR
jgi:ABC-2 type transport system permease protein